MLCIVTMSTTASFEGVIMYVDAIRSVIRRHHKAYIASVCIILHD